MNIYVCVCVAYLFIFYFSPLYSPMLTILISKYCSDNLHKKYSPIAKGTKSHKFDSSKFAHRWMANLINTISRHKHQLTIK